MTTARRVTALVVAGVLLAAGVSAWAQRGPIKIGMFVPLTGPLAANGKEMEHGFKLFLEEQSYRLGGREVKLFLEDTEAKPATSHPIVRAQIEGPSAIYLVWPLST